jgi:hypothetical protein
METLFFMESGEAKLVFQEMFWRWFLFGQIW